MVLLETSLGETKMECEWLKDNICSSPNNKGKICNSECWKWEFLEKDGD